MSAFSHQAQQQQSDPNNPFGSNHGHLGQPGFSASPSPNAYDDGEYDDRNRDTYTSEEGSADSQGRQNNEYGEQPRDAAMDRPRRHVGLSASSAGASARQES